MNVKLSVLSAGVLFFLGQSAFAQQAVDTTGTQEIEEVVVTALGIKREKKALGYSTQSVKPEELTTTPTNNFTSNLSGKVSGLSIKTSGNIGGSVDVTLRGYRSMTGNNQPLFVIDGMPMLNNSTSINSTSLNVDTGNTISDINPEDIAELNVLKGAAATALYGSRAANGAIIITTKSGKDKDRLGVDFNSSVSFSSINKETFAKYQNEYGGGYGPSYGLASDPFFEDYNGERMAPTTEDASYGGKFDPNMLVWQYTSFIPGTAKFGKAQPWVAGAHDPSYLFQDAYTTNNSVAFAKASDNANFRLSYQNVHGNDILPNTLLNKNALTFSGGYKFSEKLRANVYATYTNQNTKGKNPTGYHGMMSNFRQWWPVDVDMKEQEDLYKQFKQNISWNILSPDDLAPQYWDNAYFRLFENYITDKRERFAGSFSVNYDVTDKINILARMSHDGYTYFVDERRAVGSLADEMSIGPTKAIQPSGYAMVNQRRGENNYDLIGTYDDNFLDGFLSFKALLGTNINVQRYYSNAQGTQGGLNIPGVYTVTNSKATPPPPVIVDTTKKIYGIFGGVNFGIDDTYFIDATVRNDTSSALPADNRSYWYYSTSLSAVISQWDFLKSWDALSFAKFRASYAEVGNDLDANQLLNQYNLNPPFGGASFSFNTVAKNAELKPERTKAYEVGLNAMFLHNRIGFDFAWFRNDTSDQILALPVSTATGVTARVQNVGNMRSDGFELALNLVPVKTTDFRWNMDVNWSNPKSKVTKLASGVENITLGTFQGGVTVNASLGEKFGAIKGSDFMRDDQGRPIIGASGTYLSSNTNSIIGNMQADWFSSMVNSFTYKDFSLSFQIDWKKGGDIFSLDQYYGQATGIYPMTTFINDLGNPVRNPLSQGGGYILPGVINTAPDGQTPTYVENNIRLDASDFGAFGYQAYPAKQFVYDASFVKLRELAVTYNVPSKFLKNTGLNNASLSLVGNNLWIIHKNLPMADPESGFSAGNVQGYQAAILPTTRTYSISLRFGF